MLEAFLVPINEWWTKIFKSIVWFYKIHSFVQNYHSGVLKKTNFVTQIIIL